MSAVPGKCSCSGINFHLLDSGVLRKSRYFEEIATSICSCKLYQIVLLFASF